MTLDEYVGVLPNERLAVKELAAIKREVVNLRAENDLLCEELAKNDLDEEE